MPGKKGNQGMFSHVSKLKEPIEEAEKILDLLDCWICVIRGRDALSRGPEISGDRHDPRGKAVARPFDEPTAGMTPMETKATIGLINKLKGMVTIILIEHDINMVFAGLRQDHLMGQGMCLPKVFPRKSRRMRLLRPLISGRKSNARTQGSEYILRQKPHTAGITLDVNEGEIVCLLGRNGVGKSTTLKSIMGLVASQKGTIRFQGREIQNMRPDAIACMGISYIPEDRRIFSACP